MDYEKHYYRIVARAKIMGRKKYKPTDERFVYYENHHIIPNSFFIGKGKFGWILGNPNDAMNLVLLTPEEHYVAHQLLVKMWPGNHAMIKAANMMCTTGNDGRQLRNNKRFGWLRRMLGEVFSIEKSGKVGPNKGVPSKLKGRVGATLGQPSKKKGIPSGKKGIKIGKRSYPSPTKGIPSGRKGIPSGRKGIPSPFKGIARGPNTTTTVQLSCPHCDKSGGISGMKRYHFDNCKYQNLTAYTPGEQHEIK